MQTLDTDILILGASGAGLFAALHAKKARPELDVTIAVKGLLGKCGCIHVSRAICAAAQVRTDSCGAHYREDFPQTGDVASSRYTVVRSKDESFVVTTEPVVFTHVCPGESLLPQAAE
jgi:succinate dehydrogenase/fumarate reductase flavoprotein subunit